MQTDPEYDTSNVFSSPYTPVYASTQPEPTKMRTPSIPYNYMPRPKYTTSPGELKAYNGSSSVYTIYSNENYQKPVNDKLIETRILDFTNPATSGTFTPNVSQSSIVG
jgi:hypothetical protein